MTDDTRATGREHRRAPLDWRARLATWLLGLAAGMGVNVLSNDVGYRGVAAAAAAGAVLNAIAWLRRLPACSPLVRWTSRGLLALALLAAAVAAASTVTAFRLSGYSGVAATVLATTAVLIPTDRDRAVAMLLAVALVGMGVAVIGFGVGGLRRDGVFIGVVEVGCGVAVIGLGIDVTRGGLAAFEGGDVSSGVALVIGAGVAVTGVAIIAWWGGGVLVGVAVIGAGVAVIGTGITALWRGRTLLRVTSVLGGGVAITGMGVADLWRGDVLVGVAIIGFGVAIIGARINRLRGTGLLEHARARFVALTRDPDDDGSTSRPQNH